MPAATATAVMVLTNVGLQLFNNWRNTQTSDEMRRKQQEFQRAAQDRNHDRMMQLLREGQALQEQWETENHEQRIKNINDDFDNLIKRTFHSQALQSWPLSVLPMVMKNQSLGSFRTQSDENIALHVILTPSNSDTFNATVFSQIELGVEAFCNRHWNNLSQHPIIFYGGAWKSKTSPEQTEIDQLKADLTHLPILMITPFFTPDSGKLVFNINMWGMGKRQTNRNDEQFDINSTEMVIQPTEQEFSYYNLYALDTNYGNELTDVTIEEFVPYLQCMIGYLADVYFWSAHNHTPILPTLLSIGAVNTNGMKYLLQSNEQRYMQLLEETEKDSQSVTIEEAEKLLALYEGNYPFWDENKCERELEKIFILYANHYLEKDYSTLSEIQYDFVSEGFEEESFFPLLFIIFSKCQLKNGQNIFEKNAIAWNIINKMCSITKDEYEIFDIPNRSLQYIYHFADIKRFNAIGSKYFAFIVWNANIVIGFFVNNNYRPCVYIKNHSTRNFIFRSSTKDIKDNWNENIYLYNLTTKKISKMEKTNFEEQFGRKFERIGRGLGKIVDGVASVESMPHNSIWNDDPKESKSDNSTQKLINYFIANAGKSVPAERVENMTMQTVLDWVDDHNVALADKVYILRGYSEEHKKYVFCTFFGVNESILVKEGDSRMCFITSQYNEEMKQVFGENNICVIPLK